MQRTLHYACLALIFLPVASIAQEPAQDTAAAPEADAEALPEAAPDATSEEVLTAPPTPGRPAFHGHLPLGFAGAGLCLGNSRSWDGMRINFRDHDVDLVRGVNITFWSPRQPSIQRFEGLAVGVSPGAEESRGVSLGLLASVVADDAKGLHVGGLATVAGGGARGVNVGGLATVASGGMHGINVGGLATVAEGGLRGVNVGGLAVVSEGGVRGLNVGGLSVVSEGGTRGANLAGLAVVSEGEVRGVNLAGLAVVSEGSQRGIGLAGLATVAGDDYRGIGVGGLATVVGDKLEGVGLGGLAVVCGTELRGVGIAGLGVGSGDFGFRDLAATAPPDPDRETRASGVMLAGYRVQANEIEGLAGALLVTRAHDLTGFAFGAYNGVSGKQTGGSLGIFNYATDLQGIQIGLLNHVGTNPAWARWLPLVNARF